MTQEEKAPTGRFTEMNGENSEPGTAPLERRAGGSGLKIGSPMRRQQWCCGISRYRHKVGKYCFISEKEEKPDQVAKGLI